MLREWLEMDLKSRLTPGEAAITAHEIYSSERSLRWWIHTWAREGRIRPMVQPPGEK